MDVKKRAPTRLELHRLRFHRDGFAGQLLSFDELDCIEKGLISRDFFSELKSTYNRDPYETMASVFFSWGIMCMHPIEKRELRKHGYHCSCCGCTVIEKRHVDEAAVRSVV